MSCGSTSYSYFAYTFAPRIIDGWVYGLNSGMVGFGSDLSRGIFDNVTVQKLPPEYTFDDMDLLTVVMHELGHVLGLEDLDPDTHDLMSETLDAGVRGICLPDPSRLCRCIVMMR